MVNQVGNWIANVTERRLAQFEPHNLVAFLRDGTILCELAEKLGCGKVSHTKHPTVESRCIANIENFLSAMQMLKSSENVMFAARDLYDYNDIPKVVRALHLLHSNAPPRPHRCAVTPRTKMRKAVALASIPETPSPNRSGSELRQSSVRATLDFSEREAKEQALELESALWRFFSRDAVGQTVVRSPSDLRCIGDAGNYVIRGIHVKFALDTDKHTILVQSARENEWQPLKEWMGKKFSTENKKSENFDETEHLKSLLQRHEIKI